MNKLNFKIAFRNLVKNRTYTIFNMLGLSIGLAGFLMILLYINQETRFDKWDPELEQTYMVAADYTKNEAQFKGTKIQALFAKTTQEQVHEVENVSIGHLTGRKLSYAYSTNGVEQKGDYLTGAVDSAFFEVYPLKTLYGTFADIYHDENNIAISKRMAKLYFGDQDPIGKVLDQDRGVNFPSAKLVVKAVWDNEKQPSYFGLDVLMAEDLSQYGNQLLSTTFSTLIKLRKGTNVDEVYQKMNDNYIIAFAKYVSESSDVNFKPSVEEARKILLENGGISSFKLLMEPVSNLNLGTFFSSSAKQTTIYILISLSVFLIIISCINYTNLTLVLAQARAKEVGVKKVLGAFRAQLFKQFFLETALQCMVSFIFALILTELLLPQINQLSEQQLTLFSSANWKLIFAQSLLILVGIMVLAGAYPAIVLAGFRPAKVLKGNFNTENNVGALRRFLIVFQFTTAIALVISFMVIYAQLQFMRKKDMGLQAQQLVSFYIANHNNRNLNPQQFQHIKSKLLSVKGVEGVTRSTELAVNDSGFEDDLSYGPKSLSVELRFVDPNYFEVLKGKILKGRAFSEKTMATDTTSSIILNETASKQFGMDDVQKNLTRKNDNGVSNYNVIGIAQDIQAYGFEQKVVPTAYLATDFKWSWRKVIHVRLSTIDVTQTLSDLKTVWQEIEPNETPAFVFADESFAKMNKTYETSQRVITAFGLLTLAVSLFGLVGLAAYSAKLRVKEIAVRRILGATVQQLLQLLNKDFVKLVIIANLFADVLAYIYMKKWFSTFAYHIEMPFAVFIFTNLFILLITICIVSLQSIKTIKVSPVKALKYE